MPRGLTSTLGRCEYNGFVFDDTTRTLAVRVRPVMQEGGREVAYNEWAITLQTYVSATSTTDPQVRSAVEKLTHRGGVLKFSGRGLGFPDVNTGAVKDVLWGPVPGELQLHVVGAGNAVRLTWSVSVHLPNCVGAKYEFSALDFGYTVTHAADDAGFTTRTIAGFLRVPMTRREGGGLAYSADEYRIAMTPPLLKGWRRTFGPWVLSADRTRLDFSITDAEMPGEVLPPYVVDARASETVASQQAGLRMYTYTVSASYRLRRGKTGLTAARHFFNLVTKRIKGLELRAAQLPPQDAAGNKVPRPVPIPVAFTMSNPDLYGPPAAEFSITFTYSYHLGQIVGLAGVWEPLNDPAAPAGEPDTWEAWAASLANDSFHPYGGARLRFKVGDDRTSNLCDPSPPPRDNPDTVVQVPTTAEQRGSRDPRGYTGIPAKVSDLVGQTFRKPAPDTSWMQYQNAIYVEVDNGVVPVSVLPSRVLEAGDDVLGRAADLVGRVWDGLKPLAGALPAFAGALPAAGGAPAGPGIPGGRLEADSGPGSVRRVEASVNLYMVGYAVRCGYEIDPPRLVDVEGMEPVPANRPDRGEGYAKAVVANGQHPIHTCRWHLRYVLPRRPLRPVPVPPNPMMGGR